MKRTAKVVISILFLVFCVFLISGCGGSSEGSNNGITSALLKSDDISDVSMIVGAKNDDGGTSEPLRAKAVLPAAKILGIVSTARKIGNSNINRDMRGEEAYDAGYSAGYRRGCRERSFPGVRWLEEDTGAKYYAGYRQAYNVGYSAGYKKGLAGK